MEWHNDYGHKRVFIIPPCVESGENKNCSKEYFLEWADSQIFYKYCLLLREGAVEWNARFVLGHEKCKQLEHGKIYTWEELGRKGKGKVQFIVEELS